MARFFEAGDALYNADAIRKVVCQDNTRAEIFYLNGETEELQGEAAERLINALKYSRPHTAGDAGKLVP